MLRLDGDLRLLLRGLPLGDDHALKVLALGLLGHDFLDDGGEVGVVLFTYITISHTLLPLAYPSLAMSRLLSGMNVVLLGEGMIRRTPSEVVHSCFGSNW